MGLWCSEKQVLEEKGTSCEVIMNTDSAFQYGKRRHFGILYSPLLVTDNNYTAEMERLWGLCIEALVLDSV